MFACGSRVFLFPCLQVDKLMRVHLSTLEAKVLCGHSRQSQLDDELTNQKTSRKLLPLSLARRSSSKLFLNDSARKAASSCKRSRGRSASQVSVCECGVSPQRCAATVTKWLHWTARIQQKHAETMCFHVCFWLSRRARSLVRAALLQDFEKNHIFI